MTYTVVLATADGVVYAVLHCIPLTHVFDLCKHRLEAGRRVAIYPEKDDDGSGSP